MSSAVLVTFASIFGLVAVCMWGQLDKRVDNSKGADVTVFLLACALFCGVSGHWIPEGAGFAILAAFAWILTLGGVAFSKRG